MKNQVRVLPSCDKELLSMSHIAISGDFSRIFEATDYLAMVNGTDEAACVLRGHLVLEEFLHLWIDKVTSTEDMFKGVFIPFKSKLQVSRNLGLNDLHFEVLDHINQIRNRFGHRKGYVMQDSEIEALANKIDVIREPTKITPCREFSASLFGKDQRGNRKDTEYKYEDSDSRMRFFILFVAYMLNPSLPPKAKKQLKSQFPTTQHIEI